MFDIGWTEILVIVIITILVVGPKELPGLLRTVGKTVGNMRRMAGDFQSQFNEALREAELEDVKNTIGDVRKLNPTTAIKDAVAKEIGSVDDLTGGLTKDLNDAKNDLDAAMKPTQAPKPTPMAGAGPETPQASNSASGSETGPEPTAPVATETPVSVEPTGNDTAKAAGTAKAEDGAEKASTKADE